VPVRANQQRRDMVAPAAASKQAREIARGDPVRWYREDATAQQHAHAQKEIGAALDEAKNACRQGPAAERPGLPEGGAGCRGKEEMAALRAVRWRVQPGSTGVKGSAGGDGT
jgi:hypothetical protein